MADLMRTVLSEVKGELTQGEMEALHRKVAEVQRKKGEEELAKLEEQYKREKLILKGMKAEPETEKLEITQQRKLVKRLYDRLLNYKVDARFAVPDSLWMLLDMSELTAIQKKWLLFYVCNHGSWVKACEATDTKIHIYKEWMHPETQSEANRAFQRAVMDIQGAMLDSAEAKLMEMAAGKNFGALKMVLIASHDKYRDVRKPLVSTQSTLPAKTPKRLRREPDEELSPARKAALIEELIRQEI